MASIIKILRRRSTPSLRRVLDERWPIGHVDDAAGMLLLVLTVISQWSLLRGGTIVGMDSATQYYPWYSFLGESLRSGEIPAWNPRLLSGTPFAGDPLSGWTYLPAMLLFTFLPLTAAAKTYMFVHPLLAGLFTYALGRSLRMRPSGALLAAVAYEFSGYVYVRNTCCFPYVTVATWLPLAILGVELAIRSSHRLDRAVWWGVSGVALSQILASWLGQGSYYALLALGGYVAYRSLFCPTDGTRNLRRRVSGFVLHGGAVLLFGFGLAAAGLLPRLEYNALSGLAGGYQKSTGGWTLADWYRLFAVPNWYYIGVALLALVLLAPLVARSRFGVPYFAALALGALVLSMEVQTPLHSALYLLPGFEQLHQHYPSRAMAVFYLAAAMLAGATLTGLDEGRRKAYSAALLILAGLLFTTGVIVAPSNATPSDAAASGSGRNPWETMTSPLIDNAGSILQGSLLALALGLLTAYALSLARPALARWRGLVATSLTLVVFLDLHVAGVSAIESRSDLYGKDGIVKQDLGSYYAPTGATRFLESRSDVGQLSRYLGFAPLSNGKGGYVPTYMRFQNPEVRALEAENRGILRDGLQSIGGYNAVHLTRYDEYLAEMNGRTQDYHDAEVLPDGIESTLLNLLNVRHVIVPARIDKDSSESLQKLERSLPTVYSDDKVKVLENQDALPRTWIVHSTREASPNKALKLLKTGRVDPSKTALLESPSPKLSKPDDASKDWASVTSYENDRIQVRTSTDAAGLLVLSEVYYPAWKAYVDGEPVPVRRADQLLRAVRVPAGEHTVEMRYESSSLRAGIAISSATITILVALTIAAIVRRQRPSAPRVGRAKVRDNS